MMTKTLVVGGAGFLGGHLVSALLEQGYEVTVQDVIPLEMAGRLKPHLGKISYQWQSLLDAKVSDLEGFDSVVNLAAQADVPLAISSPKWTYAQNLGGALGLLEALRGLRSTHTKVVFMSSENVYGHVPPEQLPLSEDYPPHPMNAYAASKAAIESLCHAYALQWSIPIAIVRATTMFGEGVRLKQAIPTFIRQAITNQPITVEGDGSQSRDFCYVGNTVSGVIKALEKDFDFGIWNVGSGQETTIKNLAETIVRLTGSTTKIVHKPWRPGEQGLRLCVSIAKARKELGYEPRVGLEEGLRRTIDWMKRTGAA